MGPEAVYMAHNRSTSSCLCYADTDGCEMTGEEHKLYRRRPQAKDHFHRLKWSYAECTPLTDKRLTKNLPSVEACADHCWPIVQDGFFAYWYYWHSATTTCRCYAKKDRCIAKYRVVSHIYDLVEATSVKSEDHFYRLKQRSAHCAKGDKTEKTGITTFVKVCGDYCWGVVKDGFFSYNKEADKCVCYAKEDNCPTTTHQKYDTYSLIKQVVQAEDDS